MEMLKDTSWHRSGMTILWDAESLGSFVGHEEVVSIRQMVQLSRSWPEDLPSNHGCTLVVAGLEACLDLLSPLEAEEWLTRPFRQWILSFQDKYQSQAGLVFYVTDGLKRIHQDSSGTFIWRCGPPNTNSEIDFGRSLWSGAQEDVSWLGLSQGKENPGGAVDPIGLFLRRLS
jgi:hypothetical protein